MPQVEGEKHLTRAFLSTLPDQELAEYLNDYDRQRNIAAGFVIAGVSVFAASFGVKEISSDTAYAASFVGAAALLAIGAPPMGRLTQAGRWTATEAAKRGLEIKKGL